jgi:anti-sigma B factor antagonist
MSNTEAHIAPGGTLVFSGRLDALEAPTMRALFQARIAEGHTTLVADLSACSFIDSAALAALVSALKAVRERGGELTLVSPRSADAHRVFELTHLDKVFTMLAPTAS